MPVERDVPIGTQTPATVLLVDDDQALNRLVIKFLQKNGYHAVAETDGALALERVEREQPSLIILDVMLPGRDGLSICREVRTFFQGPILMLTALDEDIDEVAGLETGADDYLAKPVRPRVLLARIRALLRRCQVATVGTAAPGQIELGALTLKNGTREVFLHEQPVKMTAAEFDLLWLLARHAGQVLSRDTIYRRLCGRAYDGLDRMIDLRISRLRKKLGDDPDDPSLLKSVRGVGYLMVR